VILRQAQDAVRKLPVVSTIVVLIAAAIMVRLGFWQLDRADEKAALLAHYETARTQSALVEFPRDDESSARNLYRRSQVACARVISREAVAGTSARGEKGWAHLARCGLAGEGEATVALGFSRNPQVPDWSADGEIEGIVAPGQRLIASPPQAGLDQLAKPDPRDLPNNHMAYAVQWFLFALVALVIYGLAMRKRLKEQA